MITFDFPHPELCRDLNLSETKKRNLRSYLHLKQESAAATATSASSVLGIPNKSGGSKRRIPKNFRDYESLRCGCPPPPGCGVGETATRPKRRSSSATTLRVVPRLRKKEAIEANGDYRRDDYVPMKGRGQQALKTKKNLFLPYSKYTMLMGLCDTAPPFMRMRVTLSCLD